MDTDHEEEEDIESETEEDRAFLMMMKWRNNVSHFTGRSIANARSSKTVKIISRIHQKKTTVDGARQKFILSRNWESDSKNIYKNFLS